MDGFRRRRNRDREYNILELLGLILIRPSSNFVIDKVSK